MLTFPVPRNSFVGPRSRKPKSDGKPARPARLFAADISEVSAIGMSEEIFF
jgi:hypothetical protein